MTFVYIPRSSLKDWSLSLREYTTSRQTGGRRGRYHRLMQSDETLERTLQQSGGCLRRDTPRWTGVFHIRLSKVELCAVYIKSRHGYAMSIDVPLPFARGVCVVFFPRPAIDCQRNSVCDIVFARVEKISGVSHNFPAIIFVVTRGDNVKNQCAV